MKKTLALRRCYGLPKTFRLTAPADFRRVFERAIRSSDTWLTVLARPNGRDYARLGLALSRKQIRGAAQRNRIKRVIRESFRLHQRHLGSFDYVVMARAAAANADSGDLRRSLNHHWSTLLRRCANSSSA
jgi:ribonuclease P protein component